VLLVVGGAVKVVDPSGTVGALGMLGVPVGRCTVRMLAASELALGGVALAVSDQIVVALVGLSYVVFALVIGIARVRRVPIDSCGCLGRMETPPSWRHLAVVGVVAAGAAAEVFDPHASLLERLTDGSVHGIGVTVATVALTWAAVVVMRMGRKPIGGADAAGGRQSNRR
jgi:hypothetical protein